MTRWLYVFLVGGPTFQPSEIAKVAVVLFFAARLCKRDTEHKKRFTKRTGLGRTLNFLEGIGFLELVPYGVVLLVVCGLVVFEPHMSGTILIAVGAASVLFVSGISLSWFVGLGSIGAAGLWFIITQTKYMTRKINIWKDPWLDPETAASSPSRPCFPSPPAACWAGDWATATRSTASSPSRRTTWSLPS